MLSIILPDICQGLRLSEDLNKQELVNAIASMIQHLRHRSELTQMELAKRAGTSQPVIARLESGTDARLPSLYLLARIAQAADVKLSLNLE
ncbi:MAG: helix-turn-helix transcriptional regulator [Legionellales bacterium]|nr:helix-turn-helix transcriptional regulator [Legionellales bacterium]